MSAGQVWGLERGLGRAGAGAKARSALVVSADSGLRLRLRKGLEALRWTVREAASGAEAMGALDNDTPEVLVVDSYLHDLEVGEFAAQLGALYPAMDLLRVDGARVGSGAGRSPRRNEVLHVIREAQEFEPAPPLPIPVAFVAGRVAGPVTIAAPGSVLGLVASAVTGPIAVPSLRASEQRAGAAAIAIPEMVGASTAMLELARMIRLVAPRTATVLLEGETGTGKEVAAKAVHRFSARAAKPFVVLNCAAIPESLLEAELFGHTRGAFTGAVQSRMGRIEAAHGGTLFLDEIGEMPLALQAKMLRFLECGELQKVGENETIRVDVRVIAATHQELEKRAEEKTFRLDLYHRLAVFPLTVPALRDRMEDLPLLVNFFLESMGKEMPRKEISEAAMERLRGYRWPGNVRELMHVLERASILAEDRAEISADEIRVRGAGRG